MQNCLPDKTEYLFKEDYNIDCKINDNISSTSLKEDYSIKNFDYDHFYYNQNSEKKALFNNSLNNIIKKPMILQNQVFHITKVNKNSKSFSEDESELENNLELNESGNSEKIRVSPISKVNFSKLKETEKDERLKNLAKLVKRLRRKSRNLEQRFKANANKILNKYISNSVGLKKSKPNNNPFNLNIENICKSLKILRQYEKFEYDDQMHVLENFINLIAEEKLNLDSIHFRKICTQIRIFLSKESSNYIAKKGQKITFSFPEKDVNITTKEYELYSKYKDKEDVIRTVLGINEEPNQNIYPERINFEAKKGNCNENQEIYNRNISSISRNVINYNFSNNLHYQEQIKNFSVKNYNINDLVNLGMIPNNGNLQNLLINSMYSNMMQNFTPNNNQC